MTVPTATSCQAAALSGTVLGRASLGLLGVLPGQPLLGVDGVGEDAVLAGRRLDPTDGAHDSPHHDVVDDKRQREHAARRQRLHIFPKVGRVSTLLCVQRLRSDEVHQHGEWLLPLFKNAPEFDEVGCVGVVRKRPVGHAGMGPAAQVDIDAFELHVVSVAPASTLPCRPRCVTQVTLDAPATAHVCQMRTVPLPASPHFA